MGGTTHIFEINVVDHFRNAKDGYPFHSSLILASRINQADNREPSSLLIYILAMQATVSIITALTISIGWLHQSGEGRLSAAPGGVLHVIAEPVQRPATSEEEISRSVGPTDFLGMVPSHKPSAWQYHRYPPTVHH